MTEKPAVPLKEEAETKPTTPVVAQSQPKIIYQPSATGDKKPMIILQPKKSIALPTVRAPSVFKVMPSGSATGATTVSVSSAPIKVVQKPTVVTANPGTGNVIRPAFTGNVIKLMPGRCRN